MPTLQCSPDGQLHYLVDDFTDPWCQSETILLLHGNAESGAAWFGWVPSLARRFRVVRPDMRGFGGSTPMARDFPWTLDIVIGDFVRLMDALGIERFHLVGAKIGGTIARAFAARQPQRVLTLTVVGTPPPMREGAAERAPELAEEFERHGVEHWARRTMAGRLGSAFPAEGVEWWIDPRQPAAPSGLCLQTLRYFTFLPDFTPEALMGATLAVERSLERSVVGGFSAPMTFHAAYALL